MNVRCRRTAFRYISAAVAASVFLSVGALAQSNDVSIHESTTKPADGRFEVIQSPLAAKWTFRLDRYTGRVDKMVRTLFGDMAWESMSVVDLPDAASANSPRFVLFSSSIAARHTFLVDSLTGKTWLLSSLPTENSEEEQIGWVPFVE